MKPIHRKDNLHTQVIKKLLSDAELFEIEKMFRQSADTDIQIEKMNVELGNERGETSTEARAHYWYPGPSTRVKVGKILSDKLSQYFSKEIVCQHWHILNSFQPYDVHADGFDIDNPNTHLDENWEYAYTFLIPLDNYDTNTIIFEQESYTYKRSFKWLEHDKPEILDVIDDDTYNRYFTHINRDIIRYLSIDTVYHWEKGDLLAASRHSLHASDNYPQTELLEKRALVCWAYKPKLVPNSEIKYEFDTVDGHRVQCRKLNNVPWTSTAHQFTIQKNDITKTFPVWFSHLPLVGLLNHVDFKTMLDIGCGEGLISKIFKFLDKKVTTIEPGDSRPRLPECDPIEIDYKEDYLTINFEQKFDVIWSSHVAEHIRNPGIFFDKVFNDLNEGGTLALAVPYFESNDPEHIVDSHINKFSVGTMIYHLISAGFDCKHISIIVDDGEICVLLKKVSNGLPQVNTSHSLPCITPFLPETNIQHTFRSDGSWLSFKFEEKSINWLDAK